MKLQGPAKRLHRLTHSKPLVDKFFDWVDQQFEQQGWLPSNPLTKALAYIRERRAELRVFLDDPAVAIDTNYIERALRPIPMGRSNWLFCWTEAGARHVGIVQSLIATCRPARHRPVHIPGRCAAARRPTSGRARRQAHPAAVEAALRQQPASLRPVHGRGVAATARQPPGRLRRRTIAS